MRPPTWPGSVSPFLEFAVSSNRVNGSVMSTKLLFEGRSRERHHRLNQAPLYRGHIVGQVQVGLYLLIELESGKLQLDLVDRIFQVSLALNLL